MQVAIIFGLTQGGGLLDYLSQNSGLSWQGWSQFMFVFSFFVVVQLILLNIVFGITIDTFSELRDLPKI